MPRAVNESCVPGATEAVEGAIVIDCSDRTVGLITLRLLVLVKIHKVPLVVPAHASDVDKGNVTDAAIALVLLSADLLVNLPGPASPVVCPIAATFVSDDVHVARLDRSRVLPSLKRPIAANCNLVPAAIDDEPGRIVTETRLSPFTVKIGFGLAGVPLVTAPSAAEILAEPMVSAVASPVPVVTVAAAGLSELQMALFVTSWVLPSLKVAVAVNCCRDPTVMSAVAGVTAMDCTVTDATVSCVRLTTLPEVTVITDTPGASARTRPLVGAESLTVETVFGVEFHETCEVRSLVVPSL